MDQNQGIPFRTSHGLLKVDCASQTWNGIRVRYFEKYPGPGKAWADMSSDLSALVICLDQRGGYCEARLKLDKATDRSRYDAGFSVWVPANRTVWGYSERAYLVRDLRLIFDAAQFVPVLGEDINLSRVQTPIPITYDARVTQCAELLSEACLDPRSASRLYGESLTTALLAAFWSNPDMTPRKRRSGGLSPWQLRLTIEYLEENFTRDVSLQDLADLSKLSQSQFARAFKASTGLPPRQWVLQARVQRSQEMLAKADEPVASIAAGVGFADQSHFTKAFRRATGITPKRWQRDRNKRTPPDLGDAKTFAAGK